MVEPVLTCDHRAHQDCRARRRATVNCHLCRTPTGKAGSIRVRPLLHHQRRQSLPSPPYQPGVANIAQDGIPPSSRGGGSSDFSDDLEDGEADLSVECRATLVQAVNLQRDPFPGRLRYLRRGLSSCPPWVVALPVSCTVSIRSGGGSLSWIQLISARSRSRGTSIDASSFLELVYTGYQDTHSL